jgi:signal transduction histidine kinase
VNAWQRAAAGRFARLPVRSKLLLMVLLPLAGVLPALGLILMWWSSVAFDRVLITKVRADLAVAQGYFERTLGNVGASVEAIAQSRALHDALAASPLTLAVLLEQMRQRQRLDFVNLLDAEGRLRVPPVGSAGIDDGTPVLADAANGEHTSVELLSLAQLQRLYPGGAWRVPVALLPTDLAVPSTREVEDRALVLLATRAVRDRAGRLRGHVQAGVLLNRNLDFIDHVNAIVYPEGSLPFGSHGTATLFIDDVRISTNVRLFREHGAERAIGTRVSRSVREAVLERGQTWLGRAFVVSDWYVSGYMPLADRNGQRVGMLYVGFLERPFALLRWGMLGAIGVLFFGTMTLAALVSLRWARTIFQPLERMEATMQRVEAGDLGARVGPLASADEIGRLASHFDELLERIGAHTAELERWNAELDAKVAERTRALQAMQRQLVHSEKMATMGQLTASIAHEINNPIAVIQGNLDLLRELLPPSAQAGIAAEMRLLDEQVERMRLVVTQLLQFARPGEYAGYVDSVAPAALLRDCLVLVQPLLARSRVEVQWVLAPTPPVQINRQELQQVLVNLMVNAVHAMPEGGALRLATRAAEERVEIEVCDTGPGLAPEVLARLFQPFATGKKDGTGLGLWISRGIVERYGGDIRAGARDDGRCGACFTVLLPVEPAAG